MAMVASQPASFADLSWDETIVPTLRKRLENESRVISKRMSVATLGNSEEGRTALGQTSAPKVFQASSGNGGRITPSSTSTERPSAIPRPSLNYSRPSVNSTNHTPSDSDTTRSRKRRSRTISSPYKFDKDAAPQDAEKSHYVDSTPLNGLPTPASSRSNSPAMPSSSSFSPKPTRIPKAAAAASRPDGRTSPNSGYSIQAHQFSNGWPVYGNAPLASSSNVSIAVVQSSIQSVIRDESPPFSASSTFFDADANSSRISAEEERPFEHWYRGDISRNGGVGELRVANRLEMLEIANFGHKLQHFENKSTAKRRRAESIGPRESILFDDHAKDDPGQYVLDETPLTDMEQDTEFETDRDTIMSCRNTLQIDQNVMTSSVVQAIAGSQSVPAAMASSDPLPLESQIPRPAPKQNPARPMESLLNSAANAQAYSNALSTSTSMAPQSTPSTSHARSPVNSKKSKPSSSVPSSPAAKRGRTKSPPAKAAAKKPKKSTFQNKRSKSAIDVRLSRADYPEVPDGLADAIPSWTQPKVAGNWDEVVLPVVARKMGLEDQYEQADGRSKPTKRYSEEVIPPQPGTFGIDPSKYRHFEGHAIDSGPAPLHAEPSHSSEADCVIKREDSEDNTFAVSESDYRTNAYSREKSEVRKLPHIRANSPPPFARYREPSSPEDEKRLQQTFDVENIEPSGGCCKCIIM